MTNATTFAPDDAPFSCYLTVINCGDVCKSPSKTILIERRHWFRYNLTANNWNTIARSFTCY